MTEPEKSKPKSVLDLVPRFQAYYEQNPCWGNLHIVLEDRNVRDDDVLFCCKQARDDGDDEGAELAGWLLVMSKTQRLKLAGLIR